MIGSVILRWYTSSNCFELFASKPAPERHSRLQKLYTVLLITKYHDGKGTIEVLVYSVFIQETLVFDRQIQRPVAKAPPSSSSKAPL